MLVPIEKRDKRAPRTLDELKDIRSQSRQRQRSGQRLGSTSVTVGATAYLLGRRGQMGRVLKPMISRPKPMPGVWDQPMPLSNRLRYSYMAARREPLGAIQAAAVGGIGAGYSVSSYQGAKQGGIQREMTARRRQLGGGSTKARGNVKKADDVEKGIKDAFTRGRRYAQMRGKLRNTTANPRETRMERMALLAGEYRNPLLAGAAGGALFAPMQITSGRKKDVGKSLAPIANSSFARYGRASTVGYKQDEFADMREIDFGKGARYNKIMGTKGSIRRTAAVGAAEVGTLGYLGYAIGKEKERKKAAGVSKRSRTYDAESQRQRRLGVGIGATAVGAAWAGKDLKRNVTWEGGRKNPGTARRVVFQPGSGKKAAIATGLASSSAIMYGRGRSRQNKAWS